VLETNSVVVPSRRSVSRVGRPGGTVWLIMWAAVEGTHASISIEASTFVDECYLQQQGLCRAVTCNLHVKGCRDVRVS
jgi:hypothetical protein